MSELHKFLFEGLPVRGMLVRLTEGWREVIQRRQESGDPFPVEARSLMGEMAAAGVLMQANINFNGSLVLQVFGDGPVKLAVADVQSDLSFRVTSKVVGPVTEGAKLADLVNVHGQGRCSITLDPHGRVPGQQPYQGVVGLNGDHREPLGKLSEVLEHYMLQSEQLDTRLVLAANDQVAAGLLIQRLPVEGHRNLEQQPHNVDLIGLDESFNRISHLAATLTAEELLNLDAETILRRLFWEEDVRRFEPLAPRFACTCSRDRVSGMLRNLGREEVDSVIAELGNVEVGCDFCGRQYQFDAVDAGELFVPARDQPPSSSSLN